jgi:hypothetical protein
MVVISCLAAGLLFVASLLAPPIARIAPAVWSLPIVASGIWVLAISPPLPPIASKSALWARLAWLGRFLVGGLVLLGGLVLASALDQETAQERLESAMSVLVSLITPLGCVVVAILLVVDLGRLAEDARQSLVEQGLERTPWLPRKVASAVSFISAGLANPILVAFAALVMFFYLSAQIPETLKNA